MSAKNVKWNLKMKNKIVLLENDSVNRLGALYASGQVLRDPTTVLFLIPS